VRPASAHPRSARRASFASHRHEAPATGPAVATPSDAAPAIGPRLRAIRLRHGVGLRELARRLELSPSAVSRIETGKNHPSVRTLYAFASELEVTVDEVLFGHARPWGREAAPMTSSSSSSGAAPGLALQRAEGNTAIRLESGVRWRRLMLWSEEDVEFIETTYEPGDASSAPDALVRHSGHEFVHVLAGELQVVVGVDELVLGPGDSVAFPSSIPHRLCNQGDETVRAIWVVHGRRASSGESTQ
jgi:transcriptional regulator with XRE-family HTH domain